MKTSEIFRQTKNFMLEKRVMILNKNLLDHDFKTSPYICDNVGYVFGRFTEPFNVVTGVIKNRIENKFSLERWLRDNKGMDPDLLTKEAMFEYRMLWLDKLIAEFEAQGN